MMRTGTCREADGVTARWEEVLRYANGFGLVRVGLFSYNIINQQGELISEKMFCDAQHSKGFEYGYVAVKNEKEKWNFLSEQGNLLLKKWMDFVRNFADGYACVGKDGKENIIDTTGKFICSKWYDYISPLTKDGCAYVRDNGKWNSVDMQGRLLFDKWHDDMPSDELMRTARVFMKANDKHGGFVNTGANVPVPVQNSLMKLNLQLILKDLLGERKSE